MTSSTVGQQNPSRPRDAHLGLLLHDSQAGRSKRWTQQYRNFPLFVGQHSPSRPKALHPALFSHNEEFPVRPLQQSRNWPEAVGQHSPVNWRATQEGFASHDEEEVPNDSLRGTPPSKSILMEAENGAELSNRTARMKLLWIVILGCNLKNRKNGSHSAGGWLLCE